MKLMPLTEMDLLRAELEKLRSRIAALEQSPAPIPQDTPLQALTDQAQEMGLYDSPENPLIKRVATTDDFCETCGQTSEERKIAEGNCPLMAKQNCPSYDGGSLDELRALIVRLSRALRKAAPDNDLSDKALDYLQRKGLKGNPLREQSAAQAQDAMTDAARWKYFRDEMDESEKLQMLSEGTNHYDKTLDELIKFAGAVEQTRRQAMGRE